MRDWQCNHVFTDMRQVLNRCKGKGLLHASELDDQKVLWRQPSVQVRVAPLAAPFACICWSGRVLCCGCTEQGRHTAAAVTEHVRAVRRRRRCHANPL